MKKSHITPEIYLLSVLFFFLPIGESVKNIMLGIFFLYWIYLASRQIRINLVIDKYDIFFLIFILLIIGTAAFSGVKGKEWRASVDIIRIILFFLMIKKLEYHHRDLNRIVAGLFTGTVIASLFMFWYQYASGHIEGLSLISVGSPNTSAVFLSIVALMSVAYMLVHWQHLSAAAKILLLVLAAVYLTSLILTGSRAGFGAYILGLILILLISPRFSVLSKSLLLSIPLGMVVIGGLFNLEVVTEYVEEIEQGKFLQIRLELWKYAIIAGLKYPLFGLGAGNYVNLPDGQILIWASELGLDGWLSAKTYPQSHAHNIFLQAVVDRGLIGLLMLVSLLFVWGYSLVRGYKNAITGSDGDYQFAWISSLVSILTIVITGLVINGFHHEPGLLAMFCFGLMLSCGKNEKI